jgi:hypothetical protein
MARPGGKAELLPVAVSVNVKLYPLCDAYMPRVRRTWKILVMLGELISTPIDLVQVAKV